MGQCPGRLLVKSRRVQQTLSPQKMANTLQRQGRSARLDERRSYCTEKLLAGWKFADAHPWVCAHSSATRPRGAPAISIPLPVPDTEPSQVGPAPHSLPVPKSAPTRFCLPFLRPLHRSFATATYLGNVSYRTPRAAAVLPAPTSWAAARVCTYSVLTQLIGCAVCIGRCAQPGSLFCTTLLPAFTPTMGGAPRAPTVTNLARAGPGPALAASPV